MSGFEPLLMILFYPVALQPALVFGGGEGSSFAFAFPEVLDLVPGLRLLRHSQGDALPELLGAGEVRARTGIVVTHFIELSLVPYAAGLRERLNEEGAEFESKGFQQFERLRNAVCSGILQHLCISLLLAGYRFSFKPSELWFTDNNLIGSSLRGIGEIDQFGVSKKSPWSGQEVVRRFFDLERYYRPLNWKHDRVAVALNS